MALPSLRVKLYNLLRTCLRLQRPHNQHPMMPNPLNPFQHHQRAAQNYVQRPHRDEAPDLNLPCVMLPTAPERPQPRHSHQPEPHKQQTTNADLNFDTSLFLFLCPWKLFHSPSDTNGSHRRRLCPSLQIHLCNRSFHRFLCLPNFGQERVQLLDASP